MNEIKIDKGIPAPTQTGVGRKAKYPLNTMEIGESFFLGDITQSHISCCWTRYKPKKFTSKKQTENGVVGVRVWRIE